MTKKLIKIDRNGTKYYLTKGKCERCGGVGGSDKWIYTGWTCYECGGTGEGRSEIIKEEYTPEYEAKLAERRAKRRAKWEAEHAEEIAAKKEKEAAEAEARRKAEEEAEKARLEEEARIKAEKAISQFVGTIGERIEIEVEYLYSAHFEIKSFHGYGTETMYVHNFKDADGNKLTWKTTSYTMGRWNDKGEWENFEEGQKIILKGTIKEHTEYKDEKQTVLTRCKVKE